MPIYAVTVETTTGEPARIDIQAKDAEEAQQKVQIQEHLPHGVTGWPVRAVEKIAD